MKKPAAIKLDSCKIVIQNNSLFDDFFLHDGQKSQETYRELESALKAYLKKCSPEEEGVLIYRSEHLNPQNGGWYNPDRRDKFHRVVYSVTFNELLHISDLKAHKNVIIELYEISKGKAKKVSYEVLMRTWWMGISPEVKKQWLEKLLEEILFNKVIDSPHKFL